MKGRNRILALHGRVSCSDITRIQFSNLNINNDEYDVSFLDATHIEPDLMNKKANIKDDTFIEKTVKKSIYKVTGLEVESQWSLNDCGIASLGLIQLVSQLKNTFSSKDTELNLRISDVSELGNVDDLISLVSTSIKLKHNVIINQVEI